MFPTKIPITIPAKAPIKLINTLSYKNCDRISFRVAPNAFVNPISFVRSFTATSIIFISPIAAPINVINAIPIVPFSKKPRFVKRDCAMLSLLSIKKFSSSVTASFLIGLNVAVASPTAISINFKSDTITATV